MRPIRRIIVHHTASPATWRVADIRAAHLARGWCDIGYHEVVEADGRVFAGRPHDQVGAHCKGHNAASLGVVLVGSFESPNPPPPDVQYQAAVRRVVQLCQEYGLAAEDVLGHRELRPTKCPGFQMHQFRAAVAAILASVPVEPDYSPRPVC